MRGQSGEESNEGDTARNWVEDEGAGEVVCRSGGRLSHGDTIKLLDNPSELVANALSRASVSNFVSR